MALSTETKVITGVVRLSYAHVWEPASINDSDEKKYSASIIIPKSDTKTIKAIQAAVEAAKRVGMEKKWGGKLPKNLKLPLRDGDEEREDEAYQDSYFVNASSKQAPQIVGPRCTQIMSQDEVYSGCYCVASLNFYPFDTNGSRGIACGLNNIMKIRDGEPLGGRASAESDFADLEIEGYEDNNYLD